MIRKINGKFNVNSVSHLDMTMEILLLNKTLLMFWPIPLRTNLHLKIILPRFENIRLKEKSKLNFKSSNMEHYNKEFTIRELKNALKKFHDTAVGSDDIHYQFLKHLPDRSFNCLLKIFNQIWQTDVLPDSWKEAVVIHIPKPGKNSTNPSNYRPIALTSCICKTMERMVNDRLVLFLEKNKLISIHQSGFRREALLTT